KSLTEKKDFHNADGSVADVDFMNGVFEDILFAETADYKAMCLPLGNLGFNFYAILPREGKNLPLSLAEWYEVRNKMGSYDEVTVSLPKFKTEFEEVNVKEVLKAKGVKKLFDDANSLERLCSPMIDPKTLTFLHKSVLGIDESGAEGASEFMTGMDLAVIGGSGEPSGPKIGEIKLNRPFLYLIEERSTHALLFIGVINDLQK
ncbi:MAG: hypothetical protein K2K58_01885, partial [Muribaculaceae bacterium]|nr:hypothetical protein [Muribaculaceae bacterium]